MRGCDADTVTAGHPHPNPLPEGESVGRTRALVAATLGNGLEMYDFLVYAFFAIQIGKAFFPSGNPTTSLLASLATFGAGFVTRPLGAWVLGGLADRPKENGGGRREAMLISMALMGLALALLVACPPYARIGVAAPVIVVVARLLQGFALGGEVGPATAVMLEWANPERRGLVVAWQRGTQLLAGMAGSAMGLVLSWLLPPELFATAGWRIALALGLAVVPVALWLRQALPDQDQPRESVTETMPLRPALFGAAIMAGGTIGAYVQTYLATFAQATLKLSPVTALSGQLAGNAAALAACFLSGWLIDRAGRKPVLVAAYAIAALAAPPLFAWMIHAPALGSFLLGSAAFAFTSGFGITPGNVLIAENLPRGARARGFALVYTVPVAIFGATTQFVVAWLAAATGSGMAVVWYSVAGLLLAGFAGLGLRERRRGAISGA